MSSTQFVESVMNLLIGNIPISSVLSRKQPNVLKVAAQRLALGLSY